MLEDLLRYVLFNQWKKNRQEEEKIIDRIMSISHDCSRNCSNALLFKQCFLNNQEPNPKYKKDLCWYQLWSLLLLLLLLLYVPCDLGPIVWRAVQDHLCFQTTFWLIVNTYRCNSDQIKEGGIIVSIIVIKECSLLVKDNSSLRLPLSSCFKPPLLGTIQ